MQGRRDAEEEAQRLRDTVRSESEKIEQAARTEIEAAARAGRLELKALGARLSVQLAEAMLRQELTRKQKRNFSGRLSASGKERELSAVAERYAAALADVAVAHKSGEAVCKDLGSFIAAYSESADLRNALDTPSLDQDLKTKIVQWIAAKSG